LVSGWMGNGSSSNKTLPLPASTPPPSSSSASQAASAAAASASAAAHKVSASAQQWFSLVSSKVTGKEATPSTTTSSSSTNGAVKGAATSDGEEQKGLLSSDSSSSSNSLASQFQQEFSALTTLSWKNRLIAFVICLTFGSTMLGLAFFYLPLIVLAPAKFSISYSLANIFLLGSTSFLVGPWKQMNQMFEGSRAMVSIVYLVSLFLLFYVAIIIRNIFIVMPVLMVQVISLAFYVMSYVPFGQGMLKRICSWTLGRTLNFT